jgi:chromosome segregation ATPase
MILKDRLNNNERVKTENDIITKTTSKQEEYLGKEITENNKRIRSLQNKYDDLQYEIKRNEEHLTTGNMDTFNAQNMNDNLDRQLITLKESFDITKNKIKNIHSEIDIAESYINEADIDNKYLMRKLNELSLVLSKINENNNKVTIAS